MHMHSLSICPAPARRQPACALRNCIPPAGSDTGANRTKFSLRNVIRNDHINTQRDSAYGVPHPELHQKLFTTHVHWVHWCCRYPSGWKNADFQEHLYVDSVGNP